MAEHRLERVVQYADRIVYLPGDGTVEHGEPDDVLRRARRVAPPIVELGRLAGWKPLPLSIRDARRRATTLAADLADVAPPPAVAQPLARPARVLRSRGDRGALRRRSRRSATSTSTCSRARSSRSMGRNGAGKSSLLWALQGSGPRPGRRGRRSTASDPADLDPADGAPPGGPRAAHAVRPALPRHRRRGARARRRRVACRCRARRAPPSTGSRPASPATRTRATSPKASASRSCSRSSSPPTPRVVLLDEPTRGLDYHAKHELGMILREPRGRRSRDRGVDPRRRVRRRHRAPRVVMAEGEIVADGPTRRRDRRVARVRAAGREDPRAAPVAHRRATSRGAGVFATGRRRRREDRAPQAVGDRAAHDRRARDRVGRSASSRSRGRSSRAASRRSARAASRP